MSQSPMRSRVLPWPGDGQWRVWSDAWFVITVGLSLNTSLHAFTAAWVQHAYTVAPMFFAPLASFALSSLLKLSATIRETKAPLPPAQRAARVRFHAAPKTFMATLIGILARNARNDAESSFAADSGRIVGHLNCLAGGRPA